MPSVKNPHKAPRNQRVRQAKSLKLQRRRSAAGKSTINPADTTRGARPGILPTSGKGAAISKKKLRKLERKMGHAIKRQMEAEGEVEMKDAPKSKAAGSDKPEAPKDEEMADIS